MRQFPLQADRLHHDQRRRCRADGSRLLHLPLPQQELDMGLSAIDGAYIRGHYSNSVLP